MNLITDLSPNNLDSRSLVWEHPPVEWMSLPEGGFRVRVPGKVDYFQDPTGANPKDDAPYLWLSITGDFVARAFVRPLWKTIWDAGALMVRQDSTHWAKICYESTDLGTTAAVSVVTREYSDDANGVNLTSPALWVQICRSGEMFGMHYALDGKNWQMVRYFKLPLPSTVKVGLVAQCPAGPGTTIDFLHFSVELRRVENLRTGL